MKNLCMILSAISMFFAGCTSGYRVHVNGFSETDHQIRGNASVYVSVDPNSQNPIFDGEIKSRIEELLKWYEYVPAADLEQSDYRLSFEASMDSHHTSGFTPLYRPYVGFHGGYWSGYHFGYTTYVPYYDTYYDQRVGIKVYVRDPNSTSADEKVVWVGEAMISTSGEDYRRTINYLLVGCLNYFGADTSRQRSLIVTEKDPRIIRIESLK